MAGWTDWRRNAEGAQAEGAGLQRAQRGSRRCVEGLWPRVFFCPRSLHARSPFNLHQPHSHRLTLPLAPNATHHLPTRTARRGPCPAVLKL